MRDFSLTNPTRQSANLSVVQQLVFGDPDMEDMDGADDMDADDGQGLVETVVDVVEEAIDTPT